MRKVSVMKHIIATFSLCLILVLAAYEATAQSVFVRNFGKNIADTRITWSGDSLIIAGTAYASHAQSDFYVMKADTNGIPSYSFRYNYSSRDRLTHVTTAPNGDVLFAGNSWGTGPSTSNVLHPDSSAIIIGRLGPKGNLISTYRYTDTTSTRRGGTLTGLVATPDGGFAFSTLFTTSNTINQTKGISLLVTKVGPANTLQWQEQFGLSAALSNFHITAPRSALALAPNGDLVIGWHDNLSGGGINLVRLKDRLAPLPRLSWRKRFKGLRLLAVNYQQAVDSIVIYAQIKANDYGIMHLDNQGVFSWGALDFLMISVPNPLSVEAVLKPQGTYTPVLIPTLNNLTMWEENTVTPEGIENPYRGNVHDFVTQNKTAYLTLTVNSDGKNLPMLVKSTISDSVSNCYTYYTPPGRFIPLALEPDTLPVAMPVQQNRVRDSLVVLTRNLYRIDTTVICKGIGKVWPGDANSDGIANVRDVLNVGLAYGFTGPPRALAQQDSIWSPFAAQLWFNDFRNGVDHKQADCNGDGVVNRRDLVPILLNYRQMHGKTDYIPCDDSITYPPLYLQVKQDSVPAGDTLRIPVMLGDSANPVDSLYGIAFTLCYDMPLVDSLGIKYVPVDSWMGTPEKEVIGLQKDFFLNGELEVGLSRINQQNKAGHGQLGYVEIFTIDNLIGKKEFTFENLHLRLKDIYALTNSETEICLSGIQDSVTLYQEKLANPIEPVLISAQIEVFPNPTEGLLSIRTPLLMDHELHIYDSMGRLVLTQQLTGTQSTLDLRRTPKGIYVLRGQGQEKAWVKKIILR